MVLGDFLHSSTGAKHKKNFEFDEELVCGEPAPPIRVSKFNVGFRSFKGPSEHIPAKQLLERMVNESGNTRNFLYRDKNYGRNCLSHVAQLPVLNRRKCRPTFHESSNISFNISYLGIKILNLSIFVISMRT